MRRKLIIGARYLDRRGRVCLVVRKDEDYEEMKILVIEDKIGEDEEDTTLPYDYYTNYKGMYRTGSRHERDLVKMLPPKALKLKKRLLCNPK